MQKALACILALLSASAAWAQDRAVVRDLSMALLPDNNACRLVQMAGDQDQIIRLPLAGLCSFHRDASGAVRVMDADAGPIFLVETSIPLIDSPGDCDTRVLAIRLTANGAQAAPTPARVAACLPFEWDDAMFLGAF
jgi:hypothetical protein